MRSRWVLSCLVSGLLFFANGTVAKEGKFFSAQIDYLLSDIEAQGRTVADQVGTRFDLEDTLGVDTQEGVPSVDLWFHILRRNSVRVTGYFTDGPLGLTVGYRYLDLDLNVEDEGEGEITQKGFYGGIAIRF